MNKYFILLLLFFVSCDAENKPINKLKLFEIGKNYDQSIKLVLAEELGGGPSCEGKGGELAYGVGCQKIFMIKVDLLTMRCVEFDSVTNAKKEASRITR